MMPNEAQTANAPAGGPVPMPGAASLARQMEHRLRRSLRLVLGLTGVLIALGLLGYLATDRAYSRILVEAAANEALVVDLNAAAVAEVLHTRAYLITGDEQSLTSRALAARDFEDAYRALQAQAPRLSAASVEHLADFRTLHTEYEQLADEMVALHSTGASQAAVALFDVNSDPLVLRLLETRQSLRAEMQAASLAASALHSRRAAQVIGVIAAGLAACLFGGLWWVQRQVAPPLAALDYFEQALVETVQASSARPVRLPQTLTSTGAPLFQAYNTLAERLAQDGTARFEFAARIAHDLRSPLAAISGYAALLEAPPAEAEAGAAQTYARIIGAQTQRMLRTLAQMVTTAQIEEEKVQITLAPLRLDTFLRLVVDELAAQHQRRIRLDDTAAGHVVEADAGWLREVFVNLIDNAVKFSPAESEIEVQVCAAERHGWVEVRVTDHGSGMEAAEAARLFRPFTRLHHKAANGPAGSGLGLYIAKHIVQCHGGEIELKSQPRAGTTARVALPLFHAI